MVVEGRKTKLLALLGILLGVASIWVCEGDLSFFVFMTMLCGMAFFSVTKESSNEKRVSKQDLKRGKYKESDCRVG